ncbi:MAG: hypothetical protein K1V99_03155 [Bacteroidales bacterium]
MKNERKDRRYRKVVCPMCGKAFPVRILELNGTLRYSLRCKECGGESNRVLETIRVRSRDA